MYLTEGGVNTYGQGTPQLLVYGAGAAPTLQDCDIDAAATTEGSGKGPDSTAVALDGVNQYYRQNL